ncbi:hypothetical protein [Terracidiphilus gabretensis]|jgi:hypothetical protein|uniref:hypothetical protein n=1 Tax=Terracidiphilus gabretensis TaxID=1577687 RepID=UPI00071B69AE|nr:hypothetical protein [Terracidiphilus gabretensis]
MNFGSAALIGLACGFLWGIGCSLAILYSIFLGGYRRGVEDSLAEVKPDRYRRTLEKIEAHRTEVDAKARK